MNEPKDVNEMRQRLYQIAYTWNDPVQFGSSMVRAVLRQRDHQGLSGEDTYVMLAWHLLQDINRLGKMVLDNEMTKPPRPVIFPKENPGADQG